MSEVDPLLPRESTQRNEVGLERQAGIQPHTVASYRLKVDGMTDLALIANNVYQIQYALTSGISII